MSTNTTLATQGQVDRILGPYAVGWCLELYAAGYAHACVIQLFRTQKMQLFYQHNTRGSILGGWFLLAASGAMFFNVILSMIQVFYYSTLQRATLGDFYSWQVTDALAFLPVGVIASIVQTYFALRVYHFFGSGGKWIAAPLCLIILCAFTGCVTLVARLLYDQGQNLLFVRVCLSIWLWATALADLSIFALLMFKLNYFRQAETLRSTENLVSRMIRIAFATAAPTAFLGAAAAVSEAAAGRTANSVNLYPVFEKLLPPAYLLCLVYSIQTRERRRQAGLPTSGPTTSEMSELAPKRRMSRMPTIMVTDIQQQDVDVK